MSRIRQRPRAVAAHALDQRAVLRIQAEQLERAARLGDGLLPEDQPGADQVLDLADVGELLRGEDQRRVLGPAEPVEPVDQPPPVARGEQEPGLVEQHDLVHRPVAGHQPHRVGGDQLQRRDAEPLGLVVVGARDARAPAGSARAP